MKTKVLSVILPSVWLLIVQELGFDVSDAVDTGGSGNRILNAKIADPANFPFLMILEKGDMLCGGNIISNYFILTAAHCIFDQECSAIGIFPSTWMEGETSTIRAVNCHVHEKFVNPHYFYDIAIIETHPGLVEDEGLAAIRLPAPGANYPKCTNAVIAGWGETEYLVEPERLLYANVVIEDWDICNNQYLQIADLCKAGADCPITWTNIPRRSICTQGLGLRPPGTCFGDSGGGVIVNGVIAGISIGTILMNDQCAIGAPSLHTKVSDFLPWIYSIIEPGRDTSRIPVAEEFV